MFYGNGRAYSSFRDEANVPLDPKELVIESKIDWEFPGAAPDGGNLCHRTTVFHPIHLKYNRIPGSQYNADALGKMQNELLDHYNVQDLSIPDEVNVVLKEASKLRKGDYKDNPHEGMLNLAGKYMDVLDKMKQLHPGLTDPNAAQPNENVKNLHNTLIKQLGQIRRAVMDMQQADYKHLIGSKMMEMTYGNEETRPTRYLNENDYAERRQGYLDLRQGLAGMLYYHVAKSYDLEDRQWIDHLKPQTARNEIQKIETGEAFGSMINKMYDLAKKYDYYTGSRYYNFKAFLDNKLGNPAVDRYGQPVTKFKDYPSLENASREELTQRLEALEQERAQLFRDGKLNPRHYDKMPEQYFSKRLNDKERLTQFAELRVAVRSGNTEGLFARYLQHQNKVIQKNAQLNQQEQPQNEGPMLNQEAPQVKQNPEAGNIPMA
jgi:hypothetical protein